MADSLPPPPSSSSTSSSKLVYFVVVPLILLSGLVIILNQKPSTNYTLQYLHVPVNPRSGARAPSASDKNLQPMPEEEQFPVLENEETTKNARLSKTYSKLEKIEASLAQARAAIQESKRNNVTSNDLHDYIPQGPQYRNSNAFHRSYMEMEKLFKIYIYEDGEPPLFHYSKSKGILGIEGILIHQIEISKFLTKDPEKANIFFIPLSVQSIVDYAYEIHNRAWDPLQDIARDYVRLISTKVFCNANISEGFKPSIDVSLPEIYLPEGTMDGLSGGLPSFNRTIFAFYAGGVHGYIRQLLMDQWKDKDPEMQIYEYLPRDMSYYDMFRKSKFCICPSGYEVASPRMVESLYLGCVPVLLKDYYARPFDDVLDWSTFSVVVHANEIPDLKNILLGISQEKYTEMQRIGTEVRRHFEVNFPPKRYDVFHMILHSIWLRRMNIQLHDVHGS
ncbi:hypothetical protein ACJIZ3_024329 [Penstemon smallii]|uniref:Exostosin GT47 domain-containing protein n=1 Tax=Penstemon smallii TaxID=265156 RepID=A0ABD3TTK3_9LAMI